MTGAGRRRVFLHLGLTHLPDRPTWTCDDSGQDWPCPPARVELSEHYANDRVGLATYLAVLLEHAAGEAPPCPPVELYERFIAWTR